MMAYAGSGCRVLGVPPGWGSCAEKTPEFLIITGLCILVSPLGGCCWEGGKPEGRPADALWRSASWRGPETTQGPRDARTEGPP